MSLLQNRQRELHPALGNATKLLVVQPSENPRISVPVISLSRAPTQIYLTSKLSFDKSFFSAPSQCYQTNFFHDGARFLQELSGILPCDSGLHGLGALRCAPPSTSKPKAYCPTGYDTGVMGSVLAMKSFKLDFNLPTDSSGFASAKNAKVSSNVVSLLTAGAFFGSIAAAFLNDRYGRRYSLMGFSIVFILGAAVQTSAKHNIGMIYGGRVVAGLGIGGMSSITPLFVAENCPPGVRGRITGLFQEFIVIGSTFAYWLDYGAALHIPVSTKQWRIPVGLQLIFGGFLFLGLFLLKESPRWLAKQGRYEEATASLAYMRCESITDSEIQKEMAEIRASIEEEIAETEGVRWKECIRPGNRIRFIIAFLLMFWQQFSGTNSIGYYAPQIFQVSIQYIYVVYGRS